MRVDTIFLEGGYEREDEEIRRAVYLQVHRVRI